MTNDFVYRIRVQWITAWYDAVDVRPFTEIQYIANTMYRVGKNGNLQRI